MGPPGVRQQPQWVAGLAAGVPAVVLPLGSAVCRGLSVWLSARWSAWLSWLVPVPVLVSVSVLCLGPWLCRWCWLCLWSCLCPCVCPRCGLGRCRFFGVSVLGLVCASFFLLPPLPPFLPFSLVGSFFLSLPLSFPFSRLAPPSGLAPASSFFPCGCLVVSPPLRVWCWLSLVCGPPPFFAALWLAWGSFCLKLVRVLPFLPP